MTESCVSLIRPLENFQGADKSGKRCHHFTIVTNEPRIKIGKSQETLELLAGGMSWPPHLSGPDGRRSAG